MLAFQSKASEKLRHRQQQIYSSAMTTCWNGESALLLVSSGSVVRLGSGEQKAHERPPAAVVVTTGVQRRGTNRLPRGRLSTAPFAAPPAPNVSSSVFLGDGSRGKDRKMQRVLASVLASFLGPPLGFRCSLPLPCTHAVLFRAVVFEAYRQTAERGQGVPSRPSSVSLPRHHRAAWGCFSCAPPSPGRLALLRL